MVGSFPLINPQQNYDSPIWLFFKNTDGAEYRIEMNFNDLQSMYSSYRLIVPLMPNGQQVKLGDEALVSAQAKQYLAVMRYRNVLVDIQVPNKPETIRTPLTYEQLIAVIKDIYEQLLLKP